MRYATIFRAEHGWFVVLADSEGNPRFHEVRNWGMRFEDCKLEPLDNSGHSLYRSNFVMLINPNEDKPSDKEIALKSKQKRAEQSFGKSAT